jgi:hypothetical protein
MQRQPPRRHPPLQTKAENVVVQDKEIVEAKVAKAVVRVVHLVATIATTLQHPNLMTRSSTLTAVPRWLKVVAVLISPLSSLLVTAKVASASVTVKLKKYLMRFAKVPIALTVLSPVSIFVTTPFLMK